MWITILEKYLCKLRAKNFISKIYFSFISLATIGFGDLVPDSNNKTTNTTSLILACVYIIIGLAVLSMVFNLMEQEIMKNIHWLALKINIIINKKKKNSK